VSIIRLHAG